jgi:hypothetical protein
MNENWTDEKKQKLLDLWAEGKTGAQVANELGVSRNSVLGQLHRMGIKRGRVKAKDTLIAAPKLSPVPPPERRYALPPKPAPQPKPDVRPIAQGWPKPVTPTAVRFLDRGRMQCAMILDSNTTIENRMVCGAPVVPERSWCPACLKSVVGQGTMHDRIIDRDIKRGVFK